MFKIIGHRGAAGLEPENTLRSFKKALELGVDYIETDVRVTSDGYLVLMHDETVDRTTNGSGRVDRLTFEEIRRLDAGQGERVPTLEELLDLAEGRVGLHIELKDGRALERVVRLVEAKGMVDEVFLTSGDPELLKKVRELNPQIKTELIFGDPPEDAVARALEAEAKRISCHHKFLTREFVREAHESGLEVIAWPPNTIEEMRKALDFGVDLICTDRPDIAVRLKEELGED
ncbi:glycerophosphodiester phosphodiesterase [Candidatus Poribacteria bacterium]|nr:MAG: glycerophosphodiester phosphodiesterase [Candidatus Poribacteria bacterium]